MNKEEHVDVSIESNIHLTGYLTIKAITSTTSSPFVLLVNISKSSLDSCNNLDVIPSGENDQLPRTLDSPKSYKQLILFDLKIIQQITHLQISNDNRTEWSTI